MYLENLLKAFENHKTRITVILIDNYDTKILHTGEIDRFLDREHTYRVVQVYLEKDQSYTILVRPKKPSCLASDKEPSFSLI